MHCGLRGWLEQVEQGAGGCERLTERFAQDKIKISCETESARDGLELLIENH